MTEHDNVNNPQHYDLFPGQQVIDIIAAALTPEEFAGYCKGNAIKYRMRAGRKDDAMQDLAKAEWYRERLCEHHAQRESIGKASQIKRAVEAGQTVIAAAEQAQASPLDSLPTIERSELPEGAPEDAQWFCARPLGFYKDQGGAIMFFRAGSKAWRESTIKRIPELLHERSESLHRIIDDTPAADPFMPSDKEWKDSPWAQWSVVDQKGYMHLSDLEPSRSHNGSPWWFHGEFHYSIRRVKNQCDDWRTTKRQRPTHL